MFRHIIYKYTIYIYIYIPQFARDISTFADAWLTLLYIPHLCSFIPFLHDDPRYHIPLIYRGISSEIPSNSSSGWH